jgi:hypothetical protein
VQPRDANLFEHGNIRVNNGIAAFCGGNAVAIEPEPPRITERESDLSEHNLRLQPPGLTSGNRARDGNLPERFAAFAV